MALSESAIDAAADMLAAETIRVFHDSVKAGDWSAWIKLAEANKDWQFGFTVLNALVIPFISSMNARNKERNERLDQLERVVAELADAGKLLQGI